MIGMHHFMRIKHQANLYTAYQLVRSFSADQAATITSTRVIRQIRRQIVGYQRMYLD